MRSSWRAALCLAATSQVWAADCTFRANPDAFLTRESRIRRAVHEQTARSARAAKPRALASPSDIPRRNFIDDEIFGKLAALNLPSAPLSSDEDFFRRIHLDLTGRLPAPSAIRAFLADSSSSKRGEVIDRLLDSPEFADKWVMWLGDLLQNASFPANFDRREEGRNAYHAWMQKAIGENRSLRQIAYDLITGAGNTFDASTGAANFPIWGKSGMGPIQDTYDLLLVRATTTFLGVSHFDCLLCHNGRGHLDQISLWGSRVTRLEAQKMAAFFSRVNMPSRNVPAGDFYRFSFDVSDRTTGGYDMNTNWGNRPDRAAAGGVRSLTPEYLGSGDAPKDGNWRQAAADLLTNDPMLARNFANRLWKEMFGLALVEPVDGLDPARLDPKSPPPEPWTLQATHPELLEKLAAVLRDGDYNLRQFLRLLALSSAYQLSSRYDGEWNAEYVPLFNRHFPRRLMAEEIHDAVVSATGYGGNYPIRGFPRPLLYAMQLPEPAEPRSNGAVAAFLNLFLRGDRDAQPRQTTGSILQQMYLMNDLFVVNRLRVLVSPTLAEAARLDSNEAVAEELFLHFLSRRPTDYERATALEFLARAQNPAERNQWIEDLAWVLVNKVDFLFSY